MRKWHIVLNDARYKLGGKTETLCGREGIINFPKFETGPHLMTPAKTNFPIASGARFEDKKFCNSCRHAWRRITSA